MLPPRKRAEATADYLEQQHWQNNPAVGESRQINKGFLRKITEEEELASKRTQRRPFEEKDLEEAIKLTNKGKEPGPDGVKMELFEWLNKDNRRWLLNTINVWWEE